MLMTTKNGKAIAKIIAIAICALMLVACFASCSDDTAARADEAYNAALKAEEAAKEANQAAKDAQNSADNALAEAEKAENLAGTKLTEEEIVKLLEKYVDFDELSAQLGKYVDSDKLAAELGKLISEESVKALIATDVTAAKAAVMEQVNALLAQYGCPEIATKIEKAANEIVDAYAKSVEDAKADALEALLALIETKNAKLAEIKASFAYGDAAADAVRDAFELAQIKILCAKDAAAITAANTEFAAALADLPSIVDELNARVNALNGKVLIAVPGYYADGSLDEIEALEAIVALVNNDTTLADLKAEMNAYGENDVDLAAKVAALRTEYDALDDALEAAADVNALIDALAGYNTLKYGDVVAENTGLAAKVLAAQTAVDAWVNANFANDLDNVNIDRILFNRAKYLHNDEGIEADFANVDSAAEYAEYVANLPAKYTAAINTALTATKWADGYVLAGNYEALNTLYTVYTAEETKFEFVATTLDVAEGEATSLNDSFVAAWNYSAYANYVKGLYNAENSTVKAAVDALVALNGKLSINDVKATENNKFTVYTNAYDAWKTTDVATDATFTEVELADETLDDILGADAVAAIDALFARKTVLENAFTAALVLNNGVAGTETEAAKIGIAYFFTVEGDVWTLRTDLTYRDIVALRALAAERDAWATEFEIAVPAEGAEQYVVDNYGMVKNAELAEATAAAKALVDAIINTPAAQALSEAIGNLNSVTNNGTDYSTIYAYVLVQDAFDAYYAWEAELDLEALDTTGIEEFKEAGLDNVYGNLRIAEAKAKVVYDEAVAAFNADLYTAFGADFTVEGYNPTIYDEFVRLAWANAKAWVETYLMEADFGSDDAIYNVDDLDLLTSDLYAKVKGAYEKYAAYITEAKNALTAIDTKVAGFETLNLITDKKATTVDIPAEYAAWAAKYLDQTKDATKADATLTYTATATAVEALSNRYTTLATSAKNAWDADVAAKIEALAGYPANLYSSADSAEALAAARKAYNDWANTYLVGDNKLTAAAFAEMPADDAQLATYKTAIVAIETLEAAVEALADAYEAERDAIIAEIGKLPATITSADAANVAAIRARYTTWANSLRASVEDVTAVYNTEAIKTAIATLEAAEEKLADIKAAYDAVVEALGNLTTSPDKITVESTDDLTTFDTAAATYADKVAALKAAVDAYLAENSMTAIAAGTVKDYDLTADQVKAITTAYNLKDATAAIRMAHELYFEYQEELANSDYTAEEKLNRAQALATTRDALINNVVADAESGIATAEGKVETIGRIRMAAILSASGTTAEPELDDTWEDLENWGPTTTNP